MMSSSEVQRITLSAKKIVSPNGSIDLEEWEDDEDEKADKTGKVNKICENICNVMCLLPAFTDDGDENTTMEATTPISAANSDSAVHVRKGEWRIKTKKRIFKEF